MPRYDDRYGSNTRLYVGHLSSRTRSRDLDHLFSRYGRVRDVDMKRDYAFVEFSDPRDADDARYRLDGRDVDGRRITVEFAKGVPRGAGGGRDRDRDRDRDYAGRGPAPGSGRCFNCGLDGHWARDCKAGDWKNKCYKCGERGHIERSCVNSPKKSSKRERSYSRSPVRSRSPRRGRRRSRSASKSRSYSLSKSPVKKEVALDYEEKIIVSSPSKRSPSPVRISASPTRDDIMEDKNGYKDGSQSPVKSPYGDTNGRGRSLSPKDDRSPVDDYEENERSPRGSKSP